MSPSLGKDIYPPVDKYVRNNNFLPTYSLRLRVLISSEPQKERSYVPLLAAGQGDFLALFFISS